MSDKKISQLPNLNRPNYTTNDLLLINNGLAPYSTQTTSNTLVFDFLKYYTGHTNYVTGVTLNYGVLTIFVNGNLQTFPATGLTNTYLTGGTYTASTSAMTFTNNTGGTFSVTGMYFPKTPGGVVNSIQYNNNQKFLQKHLSKKIIRDMKIFEKNWSLYDVIKHEKTEAEFKFIHDFRVQFKCVFK